jgi:hypothetical protein
MTSGLTSVAYFAASVASWSLTRSAAPLVAMVERLHRFLALAMPDAPPRLPEPCNSADSAVLCPREGKGVPMAARPTVLGRFIEPCDPTGVDSPPGGERDWIHEIKWDGYRAQVHIDGPRVIGEAASTLAVKNAVLDGEVVAIGKGGKPDFQELRRREMTKHLVSGAGPRKRLNEPSVCFAEAGRKKI